MKPRRRLTAVAVVVHQDDLLEQVRRRVVDHAVDGAQDHRQGLVHKDEDHGDLRQVLGVRQLLAPVGAHTHTQELTSDGLCMLALLYSQFSSKRQQMFRVNVPAASTDLRLKWLWDRFCSSVEVVHFVVSLRRPQ